MASMIIDRLKRRQDEGLSTPKQIRYLEKYGFLHVGTWRFDQANSMIARIQSNSWRFINIGISYMNQAIRQWNEIFQIVKENCTTEYSGANPQDDLMERLLRARKG